jgi:hypothetical protein
MADLNRDWTVSVAYLSVHNWKLVQRLANDANIPWAVERELTFWPNIWTFVKELHFSNTKWIVTNLEVKTNEFNWVNITSLNISLDDNVVVQFNEKQMPSAVNSLLNVDFSKELKISAYLKNWKNCFSFEQNSDWIRWAVTRETPLDCPQPTKKLVKWVEKWDFSEYEEWFYNKAVELSKDKFPNGKITLPAKIDDFSDLETVNKKAVTVDNSISIEEVPFK